MLIQAAMEQTTKQPVIDPVHVLVMGWVMIALVVLIVVVRTLRGKPFTAQVWKLIVTLVVFAAAAFTGLTAKAIDMVVSFAEKWVNR